MHIQCSQGSQVYTIDLVEAESGDLLMGVKSYSLTIEGEGPELERVRGLILGVLSGSSGELDDIKARVSSAGFEVKDTREVYPRTCDDFINRAADTVHRTVDTMDYDGLKPYIKLLDELERGKRFSEIKLSSEDDRRGSICTGMSLAIIRNILKEHHMRCMLAGRSMDTYGFNHALAVMECQDGYVLIDNNPDRNTRLISAPFNKTTSYSFESPAGPPITFFLKAGPPLSDTPLKIIYEDGRSDEICTNVTDVEDLISKGYMRGGLSGYIPIVVYTEDGEPRKDIKVFPALEKVVLKDHLTNLRKSFTFHQVLNGELTIEELKVFMGKRVFHSKRRTIYEEIICVVSQIEPIKSVFAEAVGHPK
jgi:hypothetical protein